jgi:hypothetical protein
MVDYMHVRESMHLMIHGVELLHYETLNEGVDVVLGS